MLVKFNLLFFVSTFYVLTVSAQQFGRYGDCTSGRGICGVTVENIEGSNSSTKFTLSKKNSDTLVLNIYLSKISASDGVKIFGKTVDAYTDFKKLFFIMDADLPLTNHIKSVLTIDSEFCCIKANQYPVSEFSNGKITIYVKVY